MRGSIEPAPALGHSHITVQTSALVDDLGAMYFEVYAEDISFYFGKNDHCIHISFTERSLLNLARLVDRAVKATLDARTITIPDHVNDDCGRQPP